jgi:hypothetical protein
VVPWVPDRTASLNILAPTRLIVWSIRYRHGQDPWGGIARRAVLRADNADNGRRDASTRDLLRVNASPP